MATSQFDGPLHVSGSMQAMLAAYFGSPVADPNQDAGPSVFYQGVSVPDARIVYLKDKVQGYTGVVQSFQIQSNLKSISQIPAALGAANIAAAQVATSGTALTLAAASLGVTRNVPIRPFGNSLMGVAPVIAGAVLDFGFAFGNCTAGNTTITISDRNLFVVGMPLVIGGVGNAGGTAPLLTQVASLPTATTMTVLNAPLATNATAPIGTGDLWGPSPNGYPMPTAAYPFLASGPGLFLDPRQAVTRAVSVTGVAGGTGGPVNVVGCDIFGQTLHETITATAGATTAYGKKCYKAIFSVTPGFTDATHNYTVGTADVFGFAFRSTIWEETEVFWNGAAMAASTGWLIADVTDPATATTGDVRGVVQVSASGGGTGIGASASNGTVAALVMSGRRLEMRHLINVQSMLATTPATPQPMFGVTQF